MKALRHIALSATFAGTLALTAHAQTSTDFSSMQAVGALSGQATTATYGDFDPVNINSQVDFINGTSNSSSINHATNGLANVNSVPNFQGSFSYNGTQIPYTMMGNSPSLGATTNIPTKIVAVSLSLQNADLTTYTNVPVASFVQPTLDSPVFKDSFYPSLGGNFQQQKMQFADAIQRAEFYNMMKQNWHTELSPSVVNQITITIPRYVTVRLNGTPTQVRTYYTGKAPDGSIYVLLWQSYFNQQIFNIVNSAINAGQYTTDALNIALFPNTYLFSLSRSGGIGSCCVLGYHTYFTDGGTPTESRWTFAYASWISPGIFGGGFEDVTALSHEVAETYNDPFVNNIVPAWQFPHEPGACQGNLETGDPVEVLQSATVSVPIKTQGSTYTYHPQTEALLQWFGSNPVSNALGGAFSYPDNTALTAPATPCH